MREFRLQSVRAIGYALGASRFDRCALIEVAELLQSGLTYDNLEPRIISRPILTQRIALGFSCSRSRLLPTRPLGQHLPQRRHWAQGFSFLLAPRSDPSLGSSSKGRVESRNIVIEPWEGLSREKSVLDASTEPAAKDVGSESDHEGHGDEHEESG